MQPKPTSARSVLLQSRFYFFIAFTFICLVFSIAGTTKQQALNGSSGNRDANKPDSSGNGSNNKNEKYIAPVMVFVNGGHFIMGSNKSEDIMEKPEHRVTVDSFWMGKYEVTVAEFRKFIVNTSYVTDAEKQGFSYSFDGKSLIYGKKWVTWECDVLGNKRVNQENHPVLHVSQNDAVAYCNWLSKESGKTYRLPTEAEWEFAAKGGAFQDSFIFSGGNDIERVAWYIWNSNFATHPVGKKAPNRLGLHDMSGNAWEWCSDKFGPYSAEEQFNPKGADTGSFVVVRGGGWRFYPIICQNTGRRATLPEFNGSGPGIRLVSPAK